MYWPIGAPKIYAAAAKHTHSPQSHHPTASDDGLDTGHAVIAEDEPGNLENIHSNTAVADGADGADGAASQQAPSSIGPANPYDIVDIKVARGGHVFASITDTSLSVWQTKASYPQTPKCTESPF